MIQDTITHDFAVWRNKADFVLAVKLTNENVPKPWKWEQIWAREVESNVFEVCCIPFFAYGLALGDLVDTHSIEKKEYVIKSILKSSNIQTVRIWFSEFTDQDIVLDKIKELNCLVEPRGEQTRLLSVAALNGSSATLLRSYLDKMEKQGFLNYEDANFEADGTVG